MGVGVGVGVVVGMGVGVGVGVRVRVCDRCVCDRDGVCVWVCGMVCVCFKGSVYKGKVSNLIQSNETGGNVILLISLAAQTEIRSTKNQTN